MSNTCQTRPERGPSSIHACLKSSRCRGWPTGWLGACPVCLGRVSLVCTHTYTRRAAYVQTPLSKTRQNSGSWRGEGATVRARDDQSHRVTYEELGDVRQPAMPSDVRRLAIVPRHDGLRPWLPAARCVSPAVPSSNHFVKVSSHFMSLIFFLFCVRCVLGQSSLVVAPFRLADGLFCLPTISNPRATYKASRSTSGAGCESEHGSEGG